MGSSEEERRQRAELSAELGFWPATLDHADIERHRRLNDALDKAPDLEKIHRKWAWHREERRRAAVEAEGRARVADLYE